MGRVWGLLVLVGLCSCAPPSPCDEGQVVDFSGVCVPAACGADRFPAFPDDAPARLSVWYVDLEGPDGDGSTPESAIAQLGDALQRVATRGEPAVVLVAGSAGGSEYAGNLAIDGRHDGLWLVGRCRELVTVTSGTGVPGVQAWDASATLRNLNLFGGTPALQVMSGTWSLSHLSVERAEECGVSVTGGRVEIEDLVVAGSQPSARLPLGVGIAVSDGGRLSCTRCLLDGNKQLGVQASGIATRVTLEDLKVRGTTDGEGLGAAIRAQDRAEVHCTRCTMVGNSTVGVHAMERAVVVLEDVEVRDPHPRSDGGGLAGIQVDSAAELECVRCRLSGNIGAGMLVLDHGTLVVLDDVEVRGTRPMENGLNGEAVSVQYAATFSCTGCIFDGNTAGGILAWDPGTVVELVGLELINTKIAASENGSGGISAYLGAFLSCTDCLLDGNTEAGIGALNEGTRVVLTNVVVRNTRPKPDGLFGRAIQVAEAAELECNHCTLERNSELGIIVLGSRSKAILRELEVRETQPSPDGSAGVGIAVQKGAFASCTGCEVSGCSEAGVVATHGSRIELVNSEVLDTRASSSRSSGVGLLVALDATVELWNTQVRGSSGAGALVTSAGHLELHASSMLESGGPGIVTMGGRVGDAVTSLTMTGGRLVDNLQGSAGAGVGLLALNHRGLPSDLTLTGVSMTGNPLAGAYLRGAGSYTFVNCIFGDSDGVALNEDLSAHGNGIVATDGVGRWDDATASGLLVEHSSFSQHGGVDLLFHGSTGTLTDNAGPYQVRQQGCATDPPDALAQLGGDAGVVERCPQFEDFVLELDYRINPDMLEILELLR
jgi:hypothetical protein